MRKIFAVLLTLCLLLPAAWAEEEEELSLVDLMGGDGTEIVTGLETVEEPVPLEVRGE